jgi:hypothetical protein
MIRLFAALCKTLLEITSTDEQLFHKAIAGFSAYDAQCHNCGAVGKLVAHGDYSRNLVSFEDDQPVDNWVSPPRYLCVSCETSHALLPDIVIPYGRYSLRFRLIALIAYFEGAMTVRAICDYFVIAGSTLYRWKDNLLEHKDLMLGLLIGRVKNGLAFLNDLFESSSLSNRLQDFFRRYAFSFMQYQSAPTARSRPP